METDITIHCDGSPMVWYFGTNGEAVRLDDPLATTITRMPQRERAIAKAIVGVSTDNLEQGA